MIKLKYWAIVILATVAAGTVVIYVAQTPWAGPGPITVNHQAATSSPISELKDWKTYTNTQYGFEFQYPADLKIVEQNPNILYYQYEAAEIALQKDGKSLEPFIALGVATDTSIKNIKPPADCGEAGCPSISFALAKLQCEQYYKTKPPGIYDGITSMDFGKEPFRYSVSTVADQKSCSENTWRFLGESSSYKEVVFYGPNNIRFQFRTFLGYGVSRDVILKSGDTDLAELERQKIIYIDSAENVLLMNKIISTFKFTK